MPCLFCPFLDYATKYSTKNFLIYFHGNAEDIVYAYDFINYLREEFRMNVLAMEYAGYGAYKDCDSSSDQISHDAV